MSESKANEAILKEQQETEKRISERLQVVLEEENYSLQPFLQYSEYGIVPRVRLAAIPKEETNEQGENTEEVGGAEEETADTATEPAQNA